MALRILHQNTHIQISLSIVASRSHQIPHRTLVAYFSGSLPFLFVLVLRCMSTFSCVLLCALSDSREGQALLRLQVIGFGASPRTTRRLTAGAEPTHNRSSTGCCCLFQVTPPPDLSARRQILEPTSLVELLKRSQHPFFLPRY